MLLFPAGGRQSTFLRQQGGGLVPGALSVPEPSGLDAESRSSPSKAWFGDHRHLFEQAYSPEVCNYAQTKAATLNHVNSPAKQLGPLGIRINQVGRVRSEHRPRSRAALSWKSLKIRQLHAVGTSRSACRTWIDLRVTDRFPCELRSRPSPWVGGDQDGNALISATN